MTAVLVLAVVALLRVVWSMQQRVSYLEGLDEKRERALDTEREREPDTKRDDGGWIE